MCIEKQLAISDQVMMTALIYSYCLISNDS